jgi:RNA polymerase sigma factor (sigma-70 family)
LDVPRVHGDRDREFSLGVEISLASADLLVMTQERSPDPQELLEHDAWIRRLCARLVVDSAARDDLAQETYAAAFAAQRPRAHAAIRAWLAGIVRNRWRDGLRYSARRLHREESVARADAAPSSDTLASEVELRRVVAEAMTQLEDPLQRALVLRFFHDCTLEALAQREGIAVSTAHARVERGLERLRRALDRSNGGDREAWLGAALVTGQRGASSTTELFAMGSTLKALATFAAVAIVLFVVWHAMTTSGGAGDTTGVTVALELDERAVSGPAANSRAAALDAQRTSAAPPALGQRELEVTLLRHPDDAPLAHLAFEVEMGVHGMGSPWLLTDHEGRARLRVPAALGELSIAAAGFAPGTADISAGPAELAMRLRPTTGIYGRVLLPDGTPAPNASVSLLSLQRSVLYPRMSTRSNPRRPLQERWSEVGAGASNDSGWFYLSIDPGAQAGPARLRTHLADLAYSLDVVLAHRATDVGEIVLADAERLEISVRDFAGAPLRGVEIGTWWGGPLAVTDEEGRVVLVDPLLPTSYHARALGYRTHEVRLDGEVVRGQWQVTSTDTRVELVLDLAPLGRIRVLDAVTDIPIFLASGRADLLRGTTELGTTTFELQRDGNATVQLDVENGERRSEAPDRVRITVDKTGYRADQVFELEVSELQRVEPANLRLEPAAGFRCVRGRVMRAGNPVPRVQVGLRAVNFAGENARAGEQYHRAFTDEAGRFSLRWRDTPGTTITVHPHWLRWDEFGFIGPMSQEAADSEEHVLELVSAQRVPVVLRGVSPNQAYLYYVDVKGEVAGIDGYVSTTINGAPLEVRGEGEVRTTMLLPSDRAVRVRVNAQVVGGTPLSGAVTAEHDPAAPSLPLVFALVDEVMRVAGRVAGLPEQEWPRLAVAAELGFSSEAFLVPVRADGTFAFQQQRIGTELHLVRLAEGGGHVEVLARKVLKRGTDLQSLVLVPDTESLREKPDRR